jgi:hypothetical protein
MKTTPRLAIPYAEPGDDLNAYPVDVDLPAANLVESIWFGGAAWSTLPPAFAGTIKYRQVGGLMYVQLDLTGTYVSGTIYNWSATPMPAGLRPEMTSRGFADFNGFPGGVACAPTGILSGRHQSGANRTNFSSTLIYLIA